MPFVSVAAHVHAQQTARGLKEDRIFPRHGAGFGDVAAEGGGRRHYGRGLGRILGAGASAASGASQR